MPCIETQSVEKLQLKIGGMSCSFCVASLTKALERMEGVREANVNLAHEEALITYDPVKVMPTHTVESTFTAQGNGVYAGQADVSAFGGTWQLKVIVELKD